MTTQTQKPPSEPSVDPEFRRRTNDVFGQWQRGELSYGDTLKALLDLQQEAIEAKNLMNQGRIENLLGIIHGYRGDLNQSIVHFEQARRLNENAGAEAELSVIDLNIGETYRLKGNFTRARSYFHRASQMAKKLNKYGTQANALTNEAQMWLSLKSYRKARMILEEALELCYRPWEEEETDGDRRSRLDVTCEAHHTMVAIALSEEDHETAWENAQKAHDVAQELQYPLRLGFANRAIGDVLTVLKASPDDAFKDDPDEYYRIALDYFQEIKSESEVAKTLYHHGRSLAKRGKGRRAAKLYQQSMIIFTKLGMTDDAAKAAEAQLEVL